MKKVVKLVVMLAFLSTLLVNNVMAATCKDAGKTCSYSEATCTEAAKCFICGHIKTKAPGHDWWAQAIYANAEGVPTHVRYCDRCSGRKVELCYSSLDATCTTSKKCEVCRTVIKGA